MMPTGLIWPRTDPIARSASPDRECQRRRYSWVMHRCAMPGMRAFYDLSAILQVTSALVTFGKVAAVMRAVGTVRAC